MGEGLERAFRELKIAYDVFYYQPENWEEDPGFECQLARQLEKGKYDVVFSINYHPLISKVCSNYDRRYISWIYDSPIHIRNLEPMKDACNRIYMFDRGQVERYQKQGIPVRYMTLAADPDVFTPALKNTQGYNGEVSMVGQLYQTDYSYYMGPVDEHMRGYLEGILSAQMKIYGAYFLPELLTDKLLAELNHMYAKASGGAVSITRRELEYMLACEITSRERKLALGLIGHEIPVKLYTREKKLALAGVEICDYVDYYSRMPKVFASSKVNLNISLKCIQTGIPLRVLDVLACGGFLITNYQAELEEHFSIGEDLVVYQDLEELPALVKYYLNHEEERRRIASNGNRRVREEFGFTGRVREMLRE